MTNKKIYLSPPHLSDDALTWMTEALASNWIAPVGPHVDRFEKELAALLNVREVLTVNSGTSAIHLGLLALDVSKGDEVICSTFTFCASATPVMYCNALPVFVDSEPGTWNMDPDLLEEAIKDRIAKTGKKPKAIILVHLYGMPANMERIMGVAQHHDIPVLEDAAEALGSRYHGQAMGTFGQAGVLSFNGNKIITTSSGGALISNHAAVIEKARYFRQEAREPLPYYEHRAVGYNYRMSNLLAAVGGSQISVLDERVKRKREIFDFYSNRLADVPGISLQKEPDGVLSNRWLTTVLFEDAAIGHDAVRNLLADNNIESRRLWKPMHMQPVFREFPSYSNGVAERLFESGLCLPSGTSLCDEDLCRIVELITKSFRR